MIERKKWEAQGCAVCRRQWESGERPQFVAENIADRSRLYRCEVCGTWWLSTERYAVAVEEHEISGTYGESPGAAGSSSVRYFVRQHLQQGERVPFALLRRTTDGTTIRDEVLRDVDVWEPDRNGSIERAIRSPLDSDLEEVTAASAAAVEQMVANRRYRPLP